jgi:hypothetical protein
MIDKLTKEKQAIKVAKKVVEDYFSLNLNKRTREKQYIIARSYFYKLLRDNTKMTLSRIGKEFNKNHATVLHSVNQLEGYIEYDHYIETEYLSLNSIFLDSVDMEFLNKYDSDEAENSREGYYELMCDFKELSKKYSILKKDYANLSRSSSKLSVRHKELSELFTKREKYYARNGFIVG